MDKEENEKKESKEEQRDRRFCVRCGARLSASERQLHAGLCDGCNHIKEKIEKE